MASVTKREGSKFFIACYTDRNGRQLKRSTKTADHGQAMAMALELERVEKMARAGSLTTDQLRKVFDQVAEKVNGDTLEVPSVEQCFRSWLENIKSRSTLSTHSRYSTTVQHFLKHLGAKKDRPITAIHPQDIESFLNARLNAGLAPKTVIFDVKALKSGFIRAHRFGYIARNPVDAVNLPKDQGLERDVFTKEDVQALIGAAPTLDWQTLIILGYFVGARLSDCVHMTWENIQPGDGVIVYQQQKTGKLVVVPMHFELIRHLNYLKAFGTTGPLCPKLAAKSPGGKHGLSEGFKRIVRTAGLDLGQVQGKGIRKFCKRTFHSLRHSFNSVLANAGIPEEIRMKLTGHTTKAMNTRYTHLEVQTLSKAVNQIPLLPNG